MPIKKSDRDRRKRRTYHHGNLKAALIAAATSLLEEEGPEAISFRQIARKVGVSQTAPYNHFDGKEHLLATVAAAGFRAFTASQIAAAADARTPADRVRALGRAYVAFARAHPQLYRLMFGVGIADWRAYPELAAAAQASYQPVREALAMHLAAVGRTEPETLETASVTAWAVVHGLSTLLIDRKIDPAKMTAGDAEILADRVTTWCASGLEARPTASRIVPRT